MINIITKTGWSLSEHVAMATMHFLLEKKFDLSICNTVLVCHNFGLK